MIIRQATYIEATNKTIECIQNKDSSILYIVYEEPLVVRGSEEIPNEEYISEHNINIFDIRTGGGTIVVGQGDIGIGFASPDTDRINNALWRIRDMFIEYLRTKDIAVELSDNDLMINGYKCASYSSKAISNDMCFGAFQFSVNVDLELIRNICNKPMVKIPKGLSEFGITTEEIIDNIVLNIGEV